MRTLAKRLLTGLFGLATLACGALLCRVAPEPYAGAYTALAGFGIVIAAAWPDR